MLGLSLVLHSAEGKMFGRQELCRPSLPFFHTRPLDKLAHLYYITNYIGGYR